MKISVIIPYVNEKIYIEDCLDSLEDQTCSDFEAVVVCDHSSRAALEKLYSKKVSFPLTIMELTDRTGVAAARNAGVRKSRGEYIFFLDCDDYLDRSAFAELLHCAEEGADMVHAGLRETWYGRAVYYENGEELDARNKSAVREAKEEMDISVLGWMLRRSFLLENSISFDETYQYYTDLPYMAEVLGGGGKSSGTEHILYLKRNHNDPVQLPSLRQISDPEQKIQEVMRAYQYMKTLLSDSDEEMLDIKFIQYYARKIAPWLRQTGGEEKDGICQVSRTCLGLLTNKALEQTEPGIKRLIRYAEKHSRLQIIRRLRRREWLQTIGKVVRSRAACKLYLYRNVFSRMKLKENMIVFESFLGRSYSDSPRYIFEYLNENMPEVYQCIWILNKKKELPYPAKCIRRYSFRYFYYIGRAKYFVFNGRQSRDHIKREGSVFLETWHGTPLKKLVFDMDEVTASAPLYKKDVYDQTRDWDYLIAPNEFSEEIFRRCFLYDGKILKTGYPRNDLLYSDGKERRDRAERIRERLDIPDGKKVVLYAPTWRDDEYYAPGKHSFQLRLDLGEMKKELGGDYVLLVRTHYFVADKLDLTEYQGFARNVSDYDDIAELYLVSDLLITDYSSVFFDFANLRRPIFFFTYDLEKYRDVLRGFYIDMETELPGPMLFTTEEIIDSVRNLDRIEAEYKEKYSMFYDKYCSWEDGKASQRVADAVFDRG